MKNIKLFKLAVAVIIFIILVAMMVVIAYPKFHAKQASPTDPVIKLEQAVNNADIEQVKALIEPSAANKLEAVENLLAAFTGFDFDKISIMAKAIPFFGAMDFLDNIPKIKIEIREVVFTSDGVSDVNVSVYSCPRDNGEKTLLLDCCMKMAEIDGEWYLAGLEKAKS